MVARLKFLIIFLAIFSANTQASLHVFAGFGLNYASLGTARVGWGDYEIGKYSTRAVAINKLFRLSQSVYGSLGAGLVGDSAGMVASFGFNYPLWIGFGLRGELFAEQGFDGYSHGAATIGGSWNF